MGSSGSALGVTLGDSGDGLGFHNRGEGALLASAGRGQGRCKHRTASMTKDDLVLNVNSTELEKPCSAEIRTFLYSDPEFWCLEKGVAVTVQRTAPWGCVAILRLKPLAAGVAPRLWSDPVRREGHASRT